MATIEKLICNLKDEVSKWFYQKGEVDGKLDEKAGTSVASSSGNGLMSSTDKTKLDGIASGANKITVDSSLSSSSVNPVQNKIIYQELANKSDIDHTHEVGGTNLIPGTQDMSFENTGVGEEDGEYRGLTVLHLDNTSNDTYKDIINIDYDKDKEYGEYYTLSFWMKGTPKTNGVTSYFYGYPNFVNNQVVKSIDGWTKYYGDGQCNFNIESDWRRVWVVYQLNTIGDLSVKKRIVIRINAGADVYIAGIKLEKGDQPSDWSPAPEDIVSINKVDSALSSTSTNPVQNKVVKAQVDSLNSSKANKNHTHNDYTATTTVPCSYGTVRKFKKNGWAFVVWENIDITSFPKSEWTTVADIGWSNQAGNKYTGNFQIIIPTINRFRISEEGQLQAWREKESVTAGHYGYIVYPTAD